jgi:hypothetical protein
MAELKKAKKGKGNRATKRVVFAHLDPNVNYNYSHRWFHITGGKRLATKLDFIEVLFPWMDLLWPCWWSSLSMEWLDHFLCLAMDGGAWIMECSRA